MLGRKRCQGSIRISLYEAENIAFLSPLNPVVIHISNEHGKPYFDKRQLEISLGENITLIVSDSDDYNNKSSGRDLDLLFLILECMLLI